MLFGDGPKGNKFANAGVGENNINLRLHLRDGLVKTIKVSQLGNVSLNSRNVGADCLYGLVEFLLPAARDENVGTLFDEKFCSGQPNPICTAGDDGGLAFELFCHRLSPLLLLMLNRSVDQPLSIASADTLLADVESRFLLDDRRGRARRFGKSGVRKIRFDLIWCSPGLLREDLRSCFPESPLRLSGKRRLLRCARRPPEASFCSDSVVRLSLCPC